KEVYVPDLEREVARWTGTEAKLARRRECVELGYRVEQLEQSVSKRRTFQFHDLKDDWLYRQVSRFVKQLNALTDEGKGGLLSSGSSREHGWGIARRVAFAQSVVARTAPNPQNWASAVDAIARNSRYGGLRLVPQRDLIPIGEDPDTHFWEFAHLPTGEPA